MFKLDLEKAEEPEIKLPTSAGSLKKQESSRKHQFRLNLCRLLREALLWFPLKSKKEWQQLLNVVFVGALEKIRLSLGFDDFLAFDCVDHNKLWKILQEMGIPDHLI